MLAALLTDLRLALDEEITPYLRTYEHGELGLETEVDLQVIGSSSEAPARLLAIGAPGFGGYAPAGMLRKIVEGPLRDKAGRRQAQLSGAGRRCLLIDLSLAGGIAHDLFSPSHRSDAEAAVASIDPREFGLDLVVFYRPFAGRRRGQCDCFYVFDDEAMSREHVEALFG